MDTLFEATSTRRVAACKPFSKCGRCLRYMRLVSTRPQRLYCPTQEEVLELPAGTIASWPITGSASCAASGFFSTRTATGHTQCARGVLTTRRLWGEAGQRRSWCRERHIPARTSHRGRPRGVPVPRVWRDDKLKGRERGWLVSSQWAVPGGEPLVHRLRAGRQAQRQRSQVTVDKLDVCGACGARCPTVIYHKDRTPLAGGETAHVACLACDDLLNSSIELARGRGCGEGWWSRRSRGTGTGTRAQASERPRPEDELQKTF